MLLDDEECIAALGIFSARLRCFRRVAHAAVFVSLSAMGTLRRARQQIAVSATRSSTSSKREMPQLRVGDLVPGAGRGDRRMFASREANTARSSSCDPLFWLQSRNTLPCAGSWSSSA
jgi:hypothetical protein